MRKKLGRQRVSSTRVEAFLDLQATDMRHLQDPALQPRRLLRMRSERHHREVPHSGLPQENVASRGDCRTDGGTWHGSQPEVAGGAVGSS
jgi:hypothetical protein